MNLIQRFVFYNKMDYRAFVVDEINGQFISAVKVLNSNDLLPAEVMVEVKYSSLNYKDALSATGNKGITKKYPHTPGIDAAGLVISSDSPEFMPGDEVIVTGYDLGMNTSGGFAQIINVPAEWVVKLPNGLTLKESMIIGTAGFTAAISISKLIEQVSPEAGKIIVSGATGGVGSTALSMLNKLGYTTVAISGKTRESDFLRSLGVSEIIPREEFLSSIEKPIYSAQFAGAIDTVGGDVLAKIVKLVQPMGVITTCGSVASTSLNLTVFPFILRAVSLIGISAQNYPTNLRSGLWNRLAKELKPLHLMDLYTEIQLVELKKYIDLILKGQIKGRILVKVS